MARTGATLWALLITTTGMTAPAAPIHAATDAGGDGPPRVYREAPDDPPAAVAARANPAARTPARRVQVGPYVSVQVNVDELGRNVLGDAANEPSLTVDPTDAQTIVVGWRQFDSIASNFRQAGWAFSRDGGQSWTFPGVLEPGVFRSDPVLDVDAAGDVYYQSLDGSLRLDVFKSLDAGASWQTPVDAFGGDKNWLAVDRSGGTGDGNLYEIWQPVFACCGDDTVTRSTDGGASFDVPFSAPDNPTFGTLAVGPAGELYAAGIAATPQGQDFDTFVYAKSTSIQVPGGFVFFTGAEVDLGGSMMLGAGPNPEGLLGQAWIDVDRSDGPRRGHVYMLASVDPPGTDPLDVHLVRSTDGGLTWSAPVRVNDDDPGHWQWFGTMAVAPNGRIDVVWNDSRNGGGAANLAELFYAYSTDGGESWSDGVAVSPQFDSFLGWPNQAKLGDYYDVVADRTGSSLAYAATFNGEQDVYFLRVFPDCNENGVSDVDDVDAGTSPDRNGNDVPDACELVLSGPEPGVAGEENTLTVSAGTPDDTVVVLFARGAGSTPVPGCTDTTVALAEPAAVDVATVAADGTAAVSRAIPVQASGGRFLFQAVERGTCTVSNRVEFTFP